MTTATPTVTVHEFAQAHAAGRCHLLDVRLEEELDAASLPGALHIPLHELPQRWQELPTDLPLAVLCHHGVRSLSAAAYLQRAGLQAASVQGGIDAYSLAVDPAIPRY